MKKIVAVIPARNEEKYLPQTIQGLLDQSYPIELIIVINDGSTDKTREVALSYSKVKVFDRENRGFDAVGKAILAEVFNNGFNKVSELVPDYDFVIIVGADTVLPPNYIADLIVEFDNDKVVMVSGIIKGEAVRISKTTALRGSGRLIRSSFWKMIGEQYPVKVGWESYPIYKAMELGFECYGVPNIEMSVQRPTGKRTDYYAYGEAMRALGYFWLTALFRAIVQKPLKAKFHMIKGYFHGKERYEEDLREFVKNTQKQRIRRIIFRK